MAEPKPVQTAPESLPAVPANPSVAPGVAALETPPEVDVSDKWHVSNSDGQSGIVTATDKSSAKYAFMRKHKICDKQQTWTVTKL